MNRTLLDRLSHQLGAVPLGWAGASAMAQYVNVGDALSPVMVALCTGLSVARVPFGTTAPRLAAVGTIGHGFAGNVTPKVNAMSSTTQAVSASRPRAGQDFCSAEAGSPGVSTAWNAA